VSAGVVRELRLGTRRSPLAMAQSRWVADRIEAASVTARRPVTVRLVEVTTDGDVSTAPLSSFGGVGVFVSRLREALLAGTVDIAVHSLKDLPTAPAPGLTLAAVPVREDPRDALVARDGLTLGELPPGSLVGTGSPRRVAQLCALGLGLEVVDIRGNVDSRLKLVGTEVDAVVLALAGLRRLGRQDEATQLLDPLLMLPAPGQGALALECRSPGEPGDLGDPWGRSVLQALARLDDAPTRASVTAERALMAALEAGCAAPLGALAEVVDGDDGDELSLRAMVASVDGLASLRRSGVGLVGAAEELGRAVAAELLADGAAELVPNRIPAEVPDRSHRTGRPDRPAGTARTGESGDS
jgi:hydroxymethylbilane synthase